MAGENEKARTERAGGGMEDGMIRAAASGLGVAFYWVLLHALERQQTACRRKHGRTLLQQACYRLGSWSARGHKAAQKALNRD